MKPFKFLTSNQNDDDPIGRGVSWMWVSQEHVSEFFPNNHRIMVEDYYGIHSFLNQFPAGYIVSVISITGLNGFTHNIDNDGVGWGFNILTDLITIKWVSYNVDETI